MITELLQRSYVLDEMQQRIERLREFAKSLRQSDPVAIGCAAQQQVGVEQIEEALRQLETAFARVQSSPTEEQDDSDAFIPSDPETCILQVFAEETAESRGEVEPEPATQGLAAEDVIFTNRRLRRAPDQPEKKGLIGDFKDGRDVRYLADGALAKMVTAIRKKRAFNPDAARTCKMQGDPRLLLVGDWGSGIERAQLVGRLMRAELDAGRGQREQHAIHLGDVYYTGWEWEYRKRFLPWWPVREKDALAFGSWSLNGNHDMYSGGFGYFDALLANPRFARQHNAAGPSSFFLLENEDWQIFGLDTAWQSPDFNGMDGDLFDGQAQWMAQERARAPQKGCVVLTHHQLFSARPGHGHSPLVEKKLAAAGVRDQIDAWIWGHEHRCVVHARGFGGVPFSCCIGHGGVPVKADPPGSALPPGVAWEDPGTIKEGLFRPRYYARFGYASLDFRGAEIDLRIMGEDGRQRWPQPGQASDGVIRRKS